MIPMVWDHHVIYCEHILKNLFKLISSEIEELCDIQYPSHIRSISCVILNCYIMCPNIAKPVYAGHAHYFLSIGNPRQKLFPSVKLSQATLCVTCFYFRRDCLSRLRTLTSLSDQALTFAPVNLIAHRIYDPAMSVIGSLLLRTVADDFILNIINHDLQYTHGQPKYRIRLVNANTHWNFDVRLSKQEFPVLYQMLRMLVCYPILLRSPC